MCTFRNNLNKLLMTPLNPKDAWEVDACSCSGTLFLDIRNNSQEAWGDAQQMDRMCYYGYK